MESLVLAADSSSNVVDGLKTQMAVLSDDTLEHMSTAIQLLKTQRAEEAAQKRTLGAFQRFARVLDLLDTCFADPLRYTTYELTAEQFATHHERGENYRGLARNLAPPVQGATALQVLQHIGQDRLYSVYTFLNGFWTNDGQKTPVLIAEHPALAGYLASIAWSEEEGFSIGARHKDFDEEDAMVKRYASPVWLEKFRLADARAALAKIRSIDALTTLYLTALQERTSE